MDFVAVWKASSILVTGAFGVLGLLKDFKDKKTNKVTRWGYVSLVGILLSTSLGFVAQLKESNDDAKKTLELAKTTNTTLRGIKRTLSPIGVPDLKVSFDIDCNRNRFKQMCTALRNANEVAKDLKPLRVYWPHTASLIAQVEIYANQTDAQDALKRELPGIMADMGFEVKNAIWRTKKNIGKAGAQFAIPHDSGVQIRIEDKNPFVEGTSGRIVSLEDLPGSSIIVSGRNNQLDGLTLAEVTVRLKDGQNITAFGPFQKIVYDTTTKFIGTFNKSRDYGSIQ